MNRQAVYGVILLTAIVAMVTWIGSSNHIGPMDSTSDRSVAVVLDDAALKHVHGMTGCPDLSLLPVPVCSADGTDCGPPMINTDTEVVTCPWTCQTPCGELNGVSNGGSGNNATGYINSNNQCTNILAVQQCAVTWPTNGFGIRNGPASCTCTGPVIVSKNCSGNKPSETGC
jgi:hypothetical protein